METQPKVTQQAQKATEINRSLDPEDYFFIVRNKKNNVRQN